MEQIRRGRGRPRKDPNRLTSFQFGLAAKILSIYDQLRRQGQKHSAAVRETIERMKVLNSKIPVSEGTVRRVLATWHPRGGATVLLFEERVPNADELKHQQWVRQQIAEIQATQGLRVEAVPQTAGPKSSVLSIRFGPRPIYRRHNQKSPRD